MWVVVAVVQVATLVAREPCILLLGMLLPTMGACREVNRVLGNWVTAIAGVGAGFVLLGSAALWPAFLLVPGGLFVYTLACDRARPSWLAVGAQVAFVMLLAPFVEACRDRATLAFTVSAVFLVNMADISAGFAGKVGGPKPFPRLSPNKTWSGLLGGAGFVACLSALLLPGTLRVNAGAAASIGVLLWAASVAGDLFASRLKRIAGVKDFSVVLGPHGGFADRVDSLVLVAPLMVGLSAWIAQGAAL